MYESGDMRLLRTFLSMIHRRGNFHQVDQKKIEHDEFVKAVRKEHVNCQQVNHFCEDICFVTAPRGEDLCCKRCFAVFLFSDWQVDHVVHQTTMDEYLSRSRQHSSAKQCA